ncbi:MAG TPA: CpaF family protein [Nevskia sp.]|nr:CpaF family protein [Nevskia sp.]
MSSSPEHIERFRLSDQYQVLKANVHRHLIAQIDERNLDIYTWPMEKLDRFVADQVKRFVVDERLPVNQREIEALMRDARNELMGYGPIQSLVEDDTVNDIVVNGPHNVFVERSGKLYSVPVRFNDNNHVIRVIQRILAPLGRRVDESTPMVDARLPDGSRVNAIIPPIALDGPCLSIRKFRKSPLSAEDLLRLGSITEAELEYLRKRVEGRANLVVVGGTGSGKTTFLNLLSQWIPPGERIVTVEDAAELRLQHGHVVRLETRPPNLEGQRAVTARDLVRNALRMRPDRIIVGEVRGDEVLDMLQAMNTGHDGSMTTLHANNVRDAMHRIELLAGFAGYTGGETTLRGQIAAALQLMVQVSRLPSGQRRVISITEVKGLQGRELVMRDLFRYEADSGRHVDLREAA